MVLTADDLWPLVAKLPREEQVRLARRALARESGAAEEAESYRQHPVRQEEFADENEDPLAWDADGWEGFQ
jgi:ribose 1,5-bisphosphokinase PhnN